MIEKMNSKWLPLATASILGQAPSFSDLGQALGSVLTKLFNCQQPDACNNLYATFPARLHLKTDHESG